MKEETQFKVGDQVKIINYGHRIYSFDKEKQDIDLSPEIIGKVGIIVEAHKTQDIDNYSIHGIKGKTAWYNNNQLELIYRPEYK